MKSSEARGDVVKIVVTGALGHIGSRLCRELPSAFPGAEIVMIDNLLTLRYGSLFDLPSSGRYRFIEADILKIDLPRYFEGADAVVHLAAITDAANSFNNQDLVEEVNFTATCKVAEACEAVQCPLIYLSSTSVYGTQSEVVDEDCSPEELQPQSPYAESKLKGEQYLRELGEKRNLSFIICRFGTIAGISPGMRFHTAVNKFCWQAVMGQPITVWRTALQQKRPYLALDDAIRAINFILRNRIFDQQVYNVLTDNLTVQYIVDMIREHVPELEIQLVDTQIMNQLSYEVSNEKFRRHGFEFQGSIRDCINETINLLPNPGELPYP